MSSGPSLSFSWVARAFQPRKTQVESAPPSRCLTLQAGLAILNSQAGNAAAVLRPQTGRSSRRQRAWPSPHCSPAQDLLFLADQLPCVYGPKAYMVLRGPSEMWI